MPQFRVLYRAFLFRMVDLEVLSHGGDINKLMGQIAAMLAAVSFVFSLGSLRFAFSKLTIPQLLQSSWIDIHFLISTTLLVVGLFTVMSWDTTFPDRRDVLVLGPLPVRTRTMFAAKIAALATALGLTVAAINACTGFAQPLTIGFMGGGFTGAFRAVAAYWITAYAAGAFLVCAVLAIQGVTAQVLSRPRFLRVSGYLQLGAFAAILAAYFLEPLIATPTGIGAPHNQRILAWLPSYWFLGVFEWLNGTPHALLEPLRQTALRNLAIAAAAALAAFAMSYFRTLRRIVEEPDIVPGTHAGTWSPRAGTTLETALTLFSARTLLRSRQHRVILAWYLGAGMAIALAYLKGVQAWDRPSQSLLIASVVMMGFAITGMRAVFTLPLELNANWIFRVTAVHRAPPYLAAIRRTLVALAVTPVMLLSGIAYFSLLSWQHAAGHLLLLGVFGMAASDVWLRAFQKIPFTCSYLPGKSNVHITSLAYIVLFLALAELGVDFEMLALKNPVNYSKMLLVFAALAVWARHRTTKRQAALVFEDTEKQDIAALDLHRDGRLILHETH